MRTLLATCSVVMLLAACGSDDDSADEADSAATVREAPVDSERAPPPEQDLWAPYIESETRTAATASGRGLDQARPEPDAVLERFEKDCTSSASLPECRGLRLAVERVFLNDLIGLRTFHQPIDREIYRTAARAENPQLACVGQRELIRLGELSAEDAQLLEAALDSPWRAPRSLALEQASDPGGPPRPRGVSFPTKRIQRAGGDRYSGPTDYCIDGQRDPAPNPGLAGRYPGARHRPFASDATRRWFTTPDSPEKVLAYLTKSGAKALTAEELKNAQTADYMQGMTEFTEPGKTVDEAKMMRRFLELALTQGIDWSAGFKDLPGTGEIRFVKLTPKQVVAVFRDDILDATSIVAPRPPATQETDAEKVKREVFARTVFRF